MLTTPRYVFQKKKIIEAYEQFQRLLQDCEVYYACKANLEVKVAAVLQENVAGFEVASKEEFDRLRQIDVAPERIICGLPIKKPEVIDHLYGAGCRYFIFDDIREWEKLRQHAPEAKKILRLYICDLAPRCIEYGMTMERIHQYNTGEQPLLKSIDGLSFHISENTRIDNLLKALDRVEDLLPQLDYSSERILNIGGSYSLDAPDGFYETLHQRIQALKQRYPLRIIAEPGAAMINRAGSVWTRVVMIKERDGFNDVYIDAGIPSGIVRIPGSVRLINREATPTRRKIYRFIDTTCLHKPLFQNVLKWEIRDGDLLELGEYGAYTICFHNDFHAWSKPEVVVE